MAWFVLTLYQHKYQRGDDEQMKRKEFSPEEGPCMLSAHFDTTSASLSV